MKISKNSWHYKIHDSIGKIPKSLCPYFWLLILKIVFLAAVISILVFGTIGAGAVTYGAITFEPQLDFLNSFSGVMISLGIGILEIIVIVGGFIIHEELIKPKLAQMKWKKLQKKFDFQPKTQEKELGLFKSWLKAKKEKVCPKLDFN